MTVTVKHPKYTRTRCGVKLSKQGLREARILNSGKRWHYERAVEKAIEVLAGGFRDEQTAVARRTFQVAFRRIATGIMSRADGIVGAKLPLVEGARQVCTYRASLLEKTAERALGPGGAGREQDPRPRGGSVAVRAINTFADSARGIATFEGDSLDEKVFGGTGLRLVVVEHCGNTNESTEEAARIGDLVTDLLASGATWTDAYGTSAAVLPKDVRILTPYNAQVAALRKRVPHGVHVGTVDKFQGQEAPSRFTLWRPLRRRMRREGWNFCTAPIDSTSRSRARVAYPSSWEVRRCFACSARRRGRCSLRMRFVGLRRWRRRLRGASDVHLGPAARS
jgi:hypothetical protein